jgi:hypothetical protein
MTGTGSDFVYAGFFTWMPSSIYSHLLGANHGCPSFPCVCLLKCRIAITVQKMATGTISQSGGANMAYRRHAVRRPMYIIKSIPCLFFFISLCIVFLSSPDSSSLTIISQPGAARCRKTSREPGEVHISHAGR